MGYIPRFLQVEGYEIRDIQESLRRNQVKTVLHRKHDKPFRCHICREQLLSKKGEYELEVEDMPLRGLRSFFILKRWKGYCPKCQRIRAEEVDLISDASPHYTQDYFWWLGKLCEIAPVYRAAQLMEQDDTTLWRMDYRRMQHMLKEYELPLVNRISVDEVHAKSKKQRKKGENRDDEFFTVITDLSNNKVIWVADSRRKEALDSFFQILGPARCELIEVVAVDQHESYAASVREYCPQATIVWDRFHIMQNFQEALNEARKELHEKQDPKDEIFQLTRGKYKYLFLKKESERTEEEQSHINHILKANEEFAQLEMIKEGMLEFFNAQSEIEALDIFLTIGSWIEQKGFEPLKNWHRNLLAGWETLKNYFKYRVSTGVSEGINNVIKTLKRRAYGYRNMHYFKLKIMQQCGYLNSRFIPDPYLLRRKRQAKLALA